MAIPESDVERDERKADKICFKLKDSYVRKKNGLLDQ